MKLTTLVLAAGLALALATTAVARPGDIIVGDSGSAEVVRVKAKTGATSVISDDSRFVDPNDVVFGPDGMIYVADYQAFDGGGGVFRVNPRTGATRVVSDDPLFEQPDGIAMAPNGDLYVTDLDTSPLLRVRMPGGATSVVSNDPLIDDFTIGVVVPPNGTPIVGDDAVAARVDPLTGVASAIADSSDGLDGCCGLVRAPDGTLYMANSDTGLESINPRTGVVRDLSGPLVYGNYGMGLDFRGRVLLTNSAEITAVNPRTGNSVEITDRLDFGEGMEVEPPTCGAATATMVGTTGKDKIKGSRFADVIATLDGRDVIKGKGGKDVICGGDGRDLINGGPKSDRCKGQGGRDRERKC